MEEDIFNFNDFLDEDILVKDRPITSNIDTVHCLFTQVLQKKIIESLWNDTLISRKEKLSLSLVSWTWFQHVSGLATANSVFRKSPSKNIIKDYNEHLTNRFCLIKSYNRIASPYHIPTFKDIFTGVEFNEYDYDKLRLILSSVRSIAIELNRSIKLETVRRSCDNFLHILFNNNNNNSNNNSSDIIQITELIIAMDGSDELRIGSAKIYCILNNLLPIANRLVSFELNISYPGYSPNYPKFETIIIPKFISQSTNLQRIKLASCFSESFQSEIINSLPASLKHFSMDHMEENSYQILEKKTNYSLESISSFGSAHIHNNDIRQRILNQMFSFMVNNRLCRKVNIGYPFLLTEDLAKTISACDHIPEFSIAPLLSMKPQVMSYHSNLRELCLSMEYESDIHSKFLECQYLTKLETLKVTGKYWILFEQVLNFVANSTSLSRLELLETNARESKDKVPYNDLFQALQNNSSNVLKYLNIDYYMRSKDQYLYNFLQNPNSRYIIQIQCRHNNITNKLDMESLKQTFKRIGYISEPISTSLFLRRNYNF